jgi:hypothetical protein
MLWDKGTKKLITLQNLQKQALQLSTSVGVARRRHRWQLVQTLLESLHQETRPLQNKGNLSRLRGIAKRPLAT